MRQPSRRDHPKRVLVISALGLAYGRDIVRGVGHLGIGARWHLRIADIYDTPESLAPDIQACDGAIVMVTTDSLEQVSRQIRGPVVNVSSRETQARGVRVCADNPPIGRLGAEHLLSRGFENLGFVDHPNPLRFASRVAAFKATAQAAGARCFLHAVDAPPSSKINALAMQRDLVRWIEQLPQPIGIMGYGDRQALEVLNACDTLGVRVPEDVAVLGVGNDDMVCDITTPSLSSIALPAVQIGICASEVLDELLHGRKRKSTPRKYVFQPTRVVVRTSTDVMASDDAMLVDAIRYIREHATGGINVADVLRVVPLSRRDLERRCRASLDRSPLQEIIRVRCERAKALLTETDLPLHDVALRSGFGSAVHFINAFGKAVGATPGTFRKRNSTVRLAPVRRTDRSSVPPL